MQPWVMPSNTASIKTICSDFVEAIAFLFTAFHWGRKDLRSLSYSDHRLALGFCVTCDFLRTSLCPKRFCLTGGLQGEQVREGQFWTQEF